MMDKFELYKEIRDLLDIYILKYITRGIELSIGVYLNRMEIYVLVQDGKVKDFNDKVITMLGLDVVSTSKYDHSRRYRLKIKEQDYERLRTLLLLYT